MEKITNESIGELVMDIYTVVLEISEKDEEADALFDSVIDIIQSKKDIYVAETKLANREITPEGINTVVYDTAKELYEKVNSYRESMQSAEKKLSEILELQKKVDKQV
jgi:uncharacterized protein YoxC